MIARQDKKAGSWRGAQNNTRKLSELRDLDLFFFASGNDADGGLGVRFCSIEKISYSPFPSMVFGWAKKMQGERKIDQAARWPVGMGNCHTHDDYSPCIRLGGRAASQSIC